MNFVELIKKARCKTVPNCVRNNLTLWAGIRVFKIAGTSLLGYKVGGKI